MRTMMLVAGIAVVAAALPARSDLVLAQTTPIERTTPPVSTVNLTAEHRHIIKEIIVKEMKIEPPAAAGVPGKVGEVVPAGVPLQPIPVEVSAKIPALKAHSFLVKDGAVLIVDPKDNRIAEKVE